MNSQELKKMNRSDLLELLLNERRENERLRAELQEAEAKLADGRIEMDTVGSLTGAASKLNAIFAEAEAAAREYLNNASRPEEQEL